MKFEKKRKKKGEKEVYADVRERKERLTYEKKSRRHIVDMQ